MSKKNFVLSIVAITLVFLLPVSIIPKLFIVAMLSLNWLLNRLLPHLEKIWLSLIASLAFSTGMTMLAIYLLSTGNFAAREWWLYVMALFFITTIAPIQELLNRSKVSLSVKEYK